MKRIIFLLLALVMCLSLCACGGNDAPSTPEAPEATEKTLETKDYVIGTWERNFTTSEDEDVRQVMEVYKGGTGKFFIYTVHNGLEKNGSFEASWEIRDDVLNFTYGGSIDVTLGLILDISAQPMTLTQVDDSNAIFVKVE